MTQLRGAGAVRLGAFVRRQLGAGDVFAKTNDLLQDVQRFLNIAAEVGASSAEIERFRDQRESLLAAVGEAELEGETDASFFETEAQHLLNQVRVLAGRRDTLGPILWTAGVIGAASLVAYWVLFKSKKSRRRRT